ncbi:MAG: ABC transporter ATP-binding protein [Eubacterium sp.]|nr:ABC transporter ATP-binding protein [Eubacterium sp.]
MIRLDNVKVSFKNKVAVNLGRVIEIEEGDRVGIIGSNGAGKTTLLKSILGVVPHEGNISMDIESREIAVHMQQNEYIETVPIKVILEAIMECKIDDNPLLLEMINFFDFNECLKKRWKHLSGGQKQRLTLIMVLCKESPVTMLDEVTSGLDFETRQRLMEKLTEWYSKRDSTLLITSHYYEELESLATKILYMENGRVIDYGNKEELFEKYCGKSVVIFKENQRAEEIANLHNRIYAPAGKIAVSCKNIGEEVDVCSNLSEADINFRRSNNDIEIMTINAKMRRAL